MAGAGPSPPLGVRRIRHDARDSISAAAFSLASSVLTTALLWALARWLG